MFVDFLKKKKKELFDVALEIRRNKPILGQPVVDAAKIIMKGHIKHFKAWSTIYGKTNS
jgi:hypothetical protein